MPADLILDVFHCGKHVYSDTLPERPLQLGRFDPDPDRIPPDLLRIKQATPSGYRLAILDKNVKTVSREHVLIERIAPSRIKVTNISKTAFVVYGEEAIRPGAARELTVPAHFVIGQAEVRVAEQDGSKASDFADLNALAPSILAPPSADALSSRAVTAALLDLPNVAQPIADWLENIVSVLQSAATSADFYQTATQAMVKLVGLDSGRALKYENGVWETLALEFAPNMEEQYDRQPSRQILTVLFQEKRTLWGNPNSNLVDAAQSLTDVQTIVAAPIVDRQGQVIGALYGDRLSALSGSRGKVNPPRQQIDRVEAMLVKVLATSVAAGLARMKEEQAAKAQENIAIAAQARFGQFFGPELSAQLAADPGMLKGQNREVTLLFADIRDFSQITEHLDPEVTVEWIRDVMGVLSECVIDHKGVLVNYIGDELIAMWGAPAEQPDQALRACFAALEMHGGLPGLNARWQARLGRTFRVGIGIHTGEARVGNTGSNRKLQYGPLGNTVNLASRVQGMTKYMQSDMLITAATYGRLPDENFVTRRLCRVRVRNISEPVVLHELRSSVFPEWETLRESYESALADFEQQRFRDAAAVLSKLISAFPDDKPSLLLLSRVIERLNLGVDFDPTWDPSWIPPGK